MTIAMFRTRRSLRRGSLRRVLWSARRGGPSMPRAYQDPPEYRPDDGFGGSPQFALPQLTRATRAP